MNVSSFVSIYNPAFAQIIGAQLNLNLVAWEDADLEHPQFAGKIGTHFFPILQTHLKRNRRQSLNHLSCFYKVLAGISHELDNAPILARIILLVNNKLNVHVTGVLGKRAEPRREEKDIRFLQSAIL